MNISKRAQKVPASPMRRLLPYAKEAEKKGIMVYRTNIGQPDIKTPSIFYESISKNKPEVLGYSVSAGKDELRLAMIKYYKNAGINIEYEDINVTTGGGEAILFAMSITCDSTDEIIIFEPFYANYNGFAEMLNIKLVPITTYPETGYHLPDRKKIVCKITKKTKAILVCNPNNPTGTVFTKKEINLLGEIAKEYGLFLISDEVYREFVYDGLKSTSIMNIPDINNHAILTDSLSKRFSLCGARIGCLVSKNKTVMDSLLRMEQTRLSSPTLGQIGCIKTLQLPKSYHEKINIEYCKRRNIVYKALKEIKNVECKLPEGAFYIFAKLPIKNAENFAIWLLTSFNINKKTVMIAPGNGFYATPNMGNSEIRIAYILNSDHLKNAMIIFKEGLEYYIKKYNC